MALPLALTFCVSGAEVLAAVGSASFRDAGIHGQVNGMTAKRSPGSALKPFVFALAFDQGLAHPMTALAKPAVGQAVTDPQFGATLRRITAAPPVPGNDAAIVLDDVDPAAAARIHLRDVLTEYLDNAREKIDKLCFYN